MENNGPGHDDASADEQVPRTARHQEAVERFVLFWGEMASNWGINRTMAQIHALLYATEEPLDTDAIMDRLQISRGNANMNLRSLSNWDLIRKVHQPGSRKDFYVAEQDVWEITSLIIRERERRELRPVVDQLDECRDLLLAGRADPELTEHEQLFKERIENWMELITVFRGFSEAVLPLVQRRNVPLIQQFIAVAQQLHGEHSPAPDAGEPGDDSSD